LSTLAQRGQFTLPARGERWAGALEQGTIGLAGCSHPLKLKYEVAMIRLAFAVALVIASVLAAMAQGTPRERQACTRDAQRFCRQDLGNDGAVQGCLQMNRTKLSMSCRKVFESHGM
jgi:hypothetical protein